jgi:hypothetical protein
MEWKLKCCVLIIYHHMIYSELPKSKAAAPSIFEKKYTYIISPNNPKLNTIDRSFLLVGIATLLLTVVLLNRNEIK